MYLLYLYFILFMCTYTRSEAPTECDNESRYENNNCKCNIDFSTAVITVNKYDQISTLHENFKPFSSACIRCLLCTTIAHELHKSLMSLHDTFPPRDMADGVLVSRTLRKLCENGFKNFNLREYKNTRFLSASTLDTDHVPSILDNLWTGQLKEMCHNYLNAAGELPFYERWFEEIQNDDFVDTHFLCRSYGVYQHCRNIPMMSQKQEKSTTNRTCFGDDKCIAIN